MLQPYSKQILIELACQSVGVREMTGHQEKIDLRSSVQSLNERLLSGRDYANVQQFFKLLEPKINGMKLRSVPCKIILQVHSSMSQARCFSAKRKSIASSTISLPIRKNVLMMAPPVLDQLTRIIENLPLLVSHIEVRYQCVETLIHLLPEDRRESGIVVNGCSDRIEFAYFQDGHILACQDFLISGEFSEAQVKRWLQEQWDAVLDVMLQGSSLQGVSLCTPQRQIQLRHIVESVLGQTVDSIDPVRKICQPSKAG